MEDGGGGWQAPPSSSINFPPPPSPVLFDAMPVMIGPIVQLQVQRGPLKVGEKGAKRYVTDPVAVLERLRVSLDGVVGLDGGQEILDAHHREPVLRKNDN